MCVFIYYVYFMSWKKNTSHQKLLLLIPFIETTLFVLNVYNGDILGINENIEYMIYYLVPLCVLFGISIVNSTLSSDLILYFFEYLVLLLGIVFNIFWKYEWKQDRHRTEFYDTQCLLGSMLFTVIVKQCSVKNFPQYNLI